MEGAEQTSRTYTATGEFPSIQPQQPKHKVLWASFAIIFLALAAFGASQIRLPTFHWLPRAFETSFQAYGVLTGGNLGFNYFAPGVGSDLRVRFEIICADGQRVEERWPGDVSREAALKINNIVNLLANTMEDEKDRRNLAASWAGTVLAKYPDAHKVIVRVENYDLPTMDGWLRGARPSWIPYYKVSFERKQGKHDET